MTRVPQRPTFSTGPSTFLAERYLPSGSRALAVAESVRVQAATEVLRVGGLPIRYLGSTLVPADETCFSLFEAASIGEVRRLLDEAAVHCEHISEAFLI